MSFSSCISSLEATYFLVSKNAFLCAWSVRLWAYRPTRFTTRNTKKLQTTWNNKKKQDQNKEWNSLCFHETVRKKLMKKSSSLHRKRRLFDVNSKSEKLLSLLQNNGPYTLMLPCFNINSHVHVHNGLLKSLYHQSASLRR